MAGRPRTRDPKSTTAPKGAEPATPDAPAISPDSVSRETKNPAPEATHEVAQPPQPDARHPGGRPTKFDPSLLALAEKCGRAGLIDEQIAAIMGVATATYYTWLKAHPEFLEALKRGQTDKRARLRNTMFQKAVGFHVPEEKIFLHEGKPVRVETQRYVPPSDTMLIFLSCNEMPDEYKHVQHIQAGGSVDVNLKNTVAAPLIQQMNAFLQAMGEKVPHNGNGHHAPQPKREMAAAATRAKTSMDFHGDDDEEIPLPRRTRPAEDLAEDHEAGGLDLSELESDE